MAVPDPSKVLAEFLIVKGIGSRPPGQVWPVTYAKLPDDNPKTRIAVMNTGAIIDGRIQRSGERITHPTVQIAVRGSDQQYDTVAQKGGEIQDALDAIKLGNWFSVEINSTLYTVHAVHIYIPLMPLPQEPDTKNWRFVISAKAYITGG